MAKTIRQGFEELKANLEITTLQASTVSTRQANLRANLVKELTVLDDFLTGSYQRSTMIAPLYTADVDVFFVLDPQYFSRDENAQTNLLDRVKRAVKKYYSESTDVSRSGQAVTIQFSDFDVDVVPGFNRQGGGYVIPSATERQWIETDPKTHVTIWSERNARQNGKLVPLIKMLKQWNRSHSRKLRSFHLESLALAVFQHTAIDEYWTAAHHFFRTAPAYVGYTADPAGYGGNLAAYLDSYVKRGEVTDRFKAAEEKSQEAISLQAQGHTERAFAKWSIVFGDKFPTYG